MCFAGAQEFKGKFDEAMEHNAKLLAADLPESEAVTAKEEEDKEADALAEKVKTSRRTALVLHLSVLSRRCPRCGM